MNIFSHYDIFSPAMIFVVIISVAKLLHTLFKKRKWQSLVCSAVNDLVKRRILTPLGVGEDRTLLANARFLPKASGVRLIARVVIQCSHSLVSFDIIIL